MRFVETDSGTAGVSANQLGTQEADLRKFIRAPRPFALADGGVWQTLRAIVSQTAANKNPDATVYQVSRLRGFGIWLVALVVRLWTLTLRHRMPSEDRALARCGNPVVNLIWHNRLFFAPWAVWTLRNQRPVCGLVSASRDGADLERFFQCIGMRSVRGSSSRLGREALHKLIAAQRDGCDLAVTPDGPRGPMYDMKAGALLAARRTGASMLLFGVRYHSAWRLSSWDRFYVPKPFSRVDVRCELVDPRELERGTDVLAQLRARLLELNGEEVPVAAAGT